MSYVHVGGHVSVAKSVCVSWGEVRGGGGGGGGGVYVWREK